VSPNSPYATLEVLPIPSFVVEEEDYWEPASNTDDILQQLLERKFQEITHQNIE
jgi:hypothetical protein